VSTSPEHPTDGEWLHRRALADLPELALDNPVDPQIAAHVDSCPDCRAELESYRTVRDLARFGSVRGTVVVDGDGATPAGPGPQVWDRITAELAAPQPAGPARPDPTVGRARRVPPRRVVLSLLAAAAVLAAGFVGWTLGDQQSNAPRASAQAALAAQPGTAASAHGRAVMHTSRDGYQMTVTTAGLPAPRGYYEVWLYNPSTAKMVAIGTLGSDAQGTFTVPGGIDTQAYHVVDVSNQRYNGDPSHQTSVLRGTITTG